ncbi:MAG: hypothetical protein HYX26_03680 [Acidobacteriales bacterium]|nr:hypothetical protein [Terriglobales bacterium]
MNQSHFQSAKSFGIQYLPLSPLESNICREFSPNTLCFPIFMVSQEKNPEVVPMSLSPEPSRTCSSIKATGLKCRGLALTGNQYCYFHSRAAQRRQLVLRMLDARHHHLFNQDDRKPIARDFDDFTSKLITSLDLPEVEDMTTLNVHINAITAAFRTQQISAQAAGILLRACRLQASIMDTLKFEARTAQRHIEELADTDPDRVATDDPDPLRDPYCESLGMDQVVAAEDARRTRDLARSRAESADNAAHRAAESSAASANDSLMGDGFNRPVPAETPASQGAGSPAPTTEVSYSPSPVGAAQPEPVKGDGFSRLVPESPKDDTSVARHVSAGIAGMKPGPSPEGTAQTDPVKGDGFSRPVPTASPVASQGAGSPAPTAESVKGDGFSRPVPTASPVASQGAGSPAPTAESVKGDGFSHPASESPKDDTSVARHVSAGIAGMKPGPSPEGTAQIEGVATRNDFDRANYQRPPTNDASSPAPIEGHSVKGHGFSRAVTAPLVSPSPVGAIEPEPVKGDGFSHPVPIPSTTPSPVVATQTRKPAISDRKLLNALRIVANHQWPPSNDR